MVLSHDQLNAFSEVSRLGSFTKAADAIGVTQSALSHRIRNLEGQLATSLIIRESTGLRLTDAGSRLLKYCNVLNQIEREFIDELKPRTQTQGLGGFLRIAGASTLMWSVITPALAPLLRNHPNVQLEMLSRDLLALPSLLKSGSVDYVITCGTLDLLNCEEIHLGDEVSVLVEPKIQTSRHDVYLDHNENDRTTVEFLKRQKKSESIEKRAYLDNISGLIAGVEAGLGKAVIPQHLLSGHNLTQVKIQNELVVPVHMYFVRQSFYTKLHLAAVDALQANVARLLEH